MTNERPGFESQLESHVHSRRRTIHQERRTLGKEKKDKVINRNMLTKKNENKCILKRDERGR
jgi:hypothetical protein